ncbi:hypothetical protein EDC01DRAFT_717829 [Geopyxis carbonaria]|nr:hypothetical protein EDC01DRAFT_717829 [Geopyxis carbonaria]
MAGRFQKLDVKTDVSTASHLADELYRFVEQLPDNAREIRGVISTLVEIKGLLQEYDAHSRDPRFGRLDRKLLNDTTLGIGECSSTLAELDGIVFRCNSYRRGSQSTRSAKKCWNEILLCFRNVQGYQLHSSLDGHRDFLSKLIKLLRTTLSASRSSKKAEKVEERARMKEELSYMAMQKKRSSSRMRQMQDNHRRHLEEQAYHTGYPQTPTYIPNALPTPPLQDSPPQRPYSTPALPSQYHVPGQYSPYQGPGQHSPYQGPGQHSPYQGPGQYSPYHRFMPNSMTHERPMTPISPISPISPLTPPIASRRYSNTPAPQAARTATPPTPPLRPKTRQSHHQHETMVHGQKGSGQWWSDIFSNSAGATLLSEPPRHGSRCFGMPMETLNMAPEEVEIFRVEFDNDLMLRMFRSEINQAAKVVCTVGGGGGSWNNGRRNGYRFQTFVDASLLTISRVGSGIHLMRSNHTWAQLYFADYETLTLFYHAFLALRYQAPDPPGSQESEYWLDGERLMFSAKIKEHGDEHSLRLLKDKESGSIRLASAKVGGNVDVTMWTAFITNQICTSDWVYYHPQQPNTVFVREIRQFSFSSFFETNRRAPLPLKFNLPNDARDFINVINTEVRKMTAERNIDYRRSPQTAINRNSYF